MSLTLLLGNCYDVTGGILFDLMVQNALMRT